MYVEFRSDVKVNFSREFSGSSINRKTVLKNTFYFMSNYLCDFLCDPM